jgi:putative 4-mercaptohistidine N1-methyltranferase
LTPRQLALKDARMSALYETPRLLSEYLLFHYGTAAELISHASLPPAALDFALRTVRDLLPPNTSGARALDLGCAVGRSSFELSLHYENVLGIDYSHSFVQAAESLRAGETISYQRHDEAHHFTGLTAAAPAQAKPERIHFQQGDAMDLPTTLGKFDLVHAANLICRLTDPRLLLARLPALVNPGGLLILTTPCTWLEDFTPSRHWPQGSTLAWLQDHLAETFILEHRQDIPFLIRETARKYQHTVAEGTRWRRR